jgi:outer membrane receptor for ferric coprogen and ferric-rhodotorulic acid
LDLGWLDGIELRQSSLPLRAAYATTPPREAVDLRTGFQINSHWQAAVSFNNVPDKNYHETLGTPQLHTWYGEPRSFILRVDGKY